MHGRVDTVCLGVALSGAADLLAAGRKRLIVPDAVAMIHQVSWDMGTEFTKMIEAERGYQANASTITTADHMMQTAVQMKQ